MLKNNEKIRKILKEWFNVDNIVSVTPYGGGLINNTYLVEFEDTKYILQRINENVFHSPIGVMHNIDLITNYIRKQEIYEGKNYRNSTLTVIKTKYDENFAIVKDEYWRCYTCIDGVTYDNTEDPKIFYEAGAAIGRFHKLLDGFHTRLVSDNIKNFHNTPARFEDFTNAVKLDLAGRVEECTDLINFVNERSSTMGTIVNALETKKIPRRVVHNDTKLNNIMFDKTGTKALCMIDLDTVMKGSLVYDFGDALRLGASTAKEDETDLSKVNINFELIEAFTEGFLKNIKGLITKEEISLLMTGYYTITLELGMRFLTDYINGDKYFELNQDQKKRRPNINLERARNQLKLVSIIEQNMKELEQIVVKTLQKI